MLGRFRSLRKIYKEETKFDWLVLAADAVALVAVGLAFLHARLPETASDVGIQVATAGF